MKKIKFLALMMVAGALVFTSCKKDDETIPAPTISLSGGSSVVVPLTGDTNVVFNATISAEGKINSFTVLERKIEADGTEHTGSPNEVSDAKGETAFTYNFDKTFNAASFVEGSISYAKIEYKFTVTDKEGVSITKTYTVTLKTNQGTPFTNEVTTGNFWHTEGPNHGAYDLDADETVTTYQGGIPSTQSMRNTDPASDASDPSSFTGSWDSGNGTEFVKDTNFDYATATVEAATAAYAAGNASGTVTNPAVDDVYIAKKGNEYYVIKITSLNSDATKSNAGQIKFSYKKN